MPVLTWSWVAFHEFPYRWPASAPTFIQTCVFRQHNLVSLVFISFYTHWLTYLRLIRIAAWTPNRLICKKRSTIVSSWGPSIHSFNSIMQIIHDVLIHDLLKLSMQRCMFSSLEWRIRLSTNKISSKSIGPPWEVEVSHSLGDLLRERLTGLFRLHEAALWVDLACWLYVLNCTERASIFEGKHLGKVMVVQYLWGAYVWRWYKTSRRHWASATLHCHCKFSCGGNFETRGDTKQATLLG